MNIRELMAQYAAKIDRARELAALADGEKRDFSETERAEYLACLADAKPLGEQIAQIQAERAQLQDAEKLQAALAASANPEKPAGAGAVKTMKRSDYNQLDALAQAAYVKTGGKVED